MVQVELQTSDQNTQMTNYLMVGNARAYNQARKEIQADERMGFSWAGGNIDKYKPVCM